MQTQSQTAGPAPAGAPPAVEVVFPPDTRTRVNPTTVFPYRCIGQLRMQFPNGKVYTGTGTLIDEYRVLTCAHNLYSQGDGGYALQVTFTPARNGADAPYGAFNAAAGGLHVPGEYVAQPPPDPWGPVVDYTRFLYDFAVVRLQNAVPQFNAFPEPAPVPVLAGVTCSITGYPGDKPAGTMWGASGQVQTENTQQFLFYRISTYQGQSGSAVMANLPYPVPAIVGVHVAGAQGLNANFAVRLNQEVIAVINSWL